MKLLCEATVENVMFTEGNVYAGERNGRLADVRDNIGHIRSILLESGNGKFIVKNDPPPGSTWPTPCVPQYAYFKEVE